MRKYLTKILARDIAGLNFISACCENAEIEIKDIKFLKDNKIFLIQMHRFINEENVKKKISSICKFEFVDKVKSIKINQKDDKNKLILIAINQFKIKDKYNISLFFKDDKVITLTVEVIEATLEDQGKLKNENN